jgi:hypothetical protein
MIKYFKYILVIVIFGFISNIQSQGKLANGLVVKLSIDKNSFLVGESIYASISLKNITDESLTAIDFERIYNMFFAIYDASGTMVRYRGFWVGYSDHVNNTWNPGEIKYYHEELLNDFGDGTLTPSFNSITGVSYYLPAGTYKLRYFYPIYSINDTIASNTLSFTVKEPEGAMKDEWKELTDLYTMRPKIIDYRDTVQRYFIYKYPTGVYTEQIFYNMTLFKKNIYTENDLKDYSWFISKNPNARLIGEVIKESVKAKKFLSASDIEIKKYLNDIINNHPGTKANESASKLLGEN